MAVRVWVGGRPAVEYTVTVTIGGTWLAGETLSITIDGVALTLTIGSTVTTTQVAAEIVNAWEGSSLGTGYSANFLGTESGRHYELQASVSGSVVTLTERAFNGVTEGKTFPSLSVSETSTSGTIVLGTPSTPTGPYTFGDAANWAGGAVPANTDTIVMAGPYDCRYGIDQSATPLTTITLKILGSFVGQFGLPHIRTVSLPGGDVQFEEYRDKYFKTNAGGAITLEIGEGEGPGPALCKINANETATTGKIWKSGDPAIEGEPAIYIVGTEGTSSFQIFGGNVGFKIFGDDPDTSVASIEVTQTADSESAPTLITGRVGQGTFVSGMISVKGGTANLWHNMAANEVFAAHDGGTINQYGTLVSTGSLKAYGGRINVNGSGTIGNVLIANGSAGFSGSVVVVGGMGATALTITTCTIYNAGSSLSVEGWRSLTITNDIALAAGLRLSDVTLDIPPAVGVYKVKTTALA